MSKNTFIIMFFLIIITFIFAFIVYKLISKEIKKRTEFNKKLLETEEGKKIYENNMRILNNKSNKLMKIFKPVFIPIFSILFIFGIIGLIYLIIEIKENGKILNMGMLAYPFIIYLSINGIIILIKYK
jgi:hypothetical protein